MTSARTSKPEAVVVGSGLNALGVVRSLAPEGIPITVIDEWPGGPALNSRFVTSRALIEESAGLLDEIVAQAARKGTPPALILTQEAAVAKVSAGQERLRGKVQYDFLPTDTAARLMDKRGFHEWAQSLGFPVPRSLTLHVGGDMTPAAALAFPCILKPLTKNAAWDRRFAQKAYRFASFNELARFAAALEGERTPVIVQEWIEGNDSDVFFTLVYRDGAGKTVASFTGRKIRQWPPQVGGTASCTAAPEFEQELSALTNRFFDAVGFIGMGSMEFKRDPRSGRFVMVEPTVGRSDYQEEVATLNGANVVRAAYRSLSGLPPLTHARSNPVKIWRDAMSDERSRHAQPDLEIPASVANARRIDALFRLNDPGPALADLAMRISARLGVKRTG